MGQEARGPLVLPILRRPFQLVLQMLRQVRIGRPGAGRGRWTGYIAGDFPDGSTRNTSSRFCAFRIITKRRGEPELKNCHDIVASCGLYCGSCMVWRRCHDLENAFSGGPDSEPGGETCKGCRSDHVFKKCVHCDIRDCAREKGIDSCSKCTILPCDRLKRFETVRPHLCGLIDELYVIRSLGEAAWAETQAARWSCAFCGMPFDWYSESCIQCGSGVPGFKEAAEIDK